MSHAERPNDVEGTSLLAALSDAVARGQTLNIPAGTWRLDGRMTSAAGMLGYCGPSSGAAPRASMIGAGSDRTTLRLGATACNGIVFENLAGLTLKGFTIEACDQTAGSGILLSNVKNFSLNDIVVRHAFNNGILIADDCWYGSITQFVIENSRGAGFNGTTVNSVGYGIALAASGEGNDGAGPRPRYIRISDGLIRNPFASGVNVSEASGVQISNLQIVREQRSDTHPHTAGYAAVSVKNNAEHVQITHLYGEGTAIGFLVIGARNVNCSDCMFVRNGEQGVLIRTKVENGLPPRDVTVRNVCVVNPCQFLTSAAAAGIMLVGGDGTRLIDNSTSSQDGKMAYGFLEIESPTNTEFRGNSSRGARIRNVARRSGLLRGWHMGVRKYFGRAGD